MYGHFVEQNNVLISPWITLHSVRDYNAGA